MTAQQDYLEDIFRLQRQLNLRIGLDTHEIQDNPEEKQKWILNYSRALSQEIAELVDSVPWKWWANYQTFDQQNARVEIVDMMHFLVSLCQVMGMEAKDLHELYVKKHQVNTERQDSGYKEKNAEDNRGL